MQGEFDGAFQALAVRIRSIGADGAVRGCTDEQITQVAEHWGGPVPSSFQSFLRIMGQEAGPLWRDSNHLVPQLLELDPAWLHELAEELEVVLPEGEVRLINAHDGYEFQWMLLQQSDEADPPVWELLETEKPQLRLVAHSYSQYIGNAVARVATFYAEHPNFDYWNYQWPG